MYNLNIFIFKMNIGACQPVATVGAFILVPTLPCSQVCNSFEDQAPIDFIYRCRIFKWVAETWLKR